MLVWPWWHAVVHEEALIYQVTHLPSYSSTKAPRIKD